MSMSTENTVTPKIKGKDVGKILGYMNTSTLIAIDKSYLDELDDNYLYALDIYLNKLGKSELVYDFPDKPWEEVWTRNSKIIIEFCKARKMIIFQYCDGWTASGSTIEIKSGTLILVDASELIECLSYPDLEMEIIQEIDDIDTGVYEVRLDEFNHIKLRKT